MMVCQSTPLSNEQVIQLRQAVMEMAQNAIEWGNLHETDRLVNITYRVYDDRLEIVVRDQGPGFDREPPCRTRRCRATRSRIWTCGRSWACAPADLGS